MADDLVRLNVGGAIYLTTKSTLCRYPDSMLGAMFNGSFPTAHDSQGNYFIDRDGTIFGFILNFLRSSQLALPADFYQWDQLSVEADFYQIQPLILAIKECRDAPKRAPLPFGHFLEIIEVRTGSTATMPTNNSRVKTIISGRKDVIMSLPSTLVGSTEKLHYKEDCDFTELELNGSNVRLKIAEHLQATGWKLVDSSMSSSSAYDSKALISSLIIEQSYRDRWYLAAE